MWNHYRIAWLSCGLTIYEDQDEDHYEDQDHCEDQGHYEDQDKKVRSKELAKENY